MSKQIIYPNFISRLFSSMIDLCILMIILTPCINILGKYMYLYGFREMFIAHNIDISDIEAIQQALSDPEFILQIDTSKVIICMIILNAINIAAMGVYFIFCWHRFGATPGKFIMRMRVVRQGDHAKISIWQGVKRFCSYVTALIGIWSIIFSKKGLSLHDKISGTIVIKS